MPLRYLVPKQIKGKELYISLSHFTYCKSRDYFLILDELVQGVIHECLAFTDYSRQQK